MPACLVAASSSWADQVVYFVNGKAMMVKSVERGERFTILEIEGGGRMGVPTEQIVRIEEYQVSAATPGLPAAPQLAIAGTAPLQPAAGSPTAPGSLGPGVGGAAPAPGQGMTGLTPLNVGGTAGQAYQSPRPTQAYPNRPTIAGGPAGAIVPPGGQRPALYGPGGRRLGRQGMGRRGGPVPYAPPGLQPGQTTNPPPASGNQETTPPPEPPPDDAEEQPVPDDGAPEEPAAGGAPQTPGGSS
jgi:hypothetical protein